MPRRRSGSRPRGSPRGYGPRGHGTPSGRVDVVPREVFRSGQCERGLDVHRHGHDRERTPAGGRDACPRSALDHEDWCCVPPRSTAMAARPPLLARRWNRQWHASWSCVHVSGWRTTAPTCALTCPGYWSRGSTSCRPATAQRSCTRSRCGFLISYSATSLRPSSTASSYWPTPD